MDNEIFSEISYRILRAFQKYWIKYVSQNAVDLHIKMIPHSHALVYNVDVCTSTAETVCKSSSVINWYENEMLAVWCWHWQAHIYGRVDRKFMHFFVHNEKTKTVSHILFRIKYAVICVRIRRAVFAFCFNDLLISSNKWEREYAKGMKCHFHFDLYFKMLMSTEEHSSIWKVTFKP